MIAELNRAVDEVESHLATDPSAPVDVAALAVRRAGWLGAVTARA